MRRLAEILFVLVAVSAMEAQTITSIPAAAGGGGGGGAAPGACPADQYTIQTTGGGVVCATITNNALPAVFDISTKTSTRPVKTGNLASRPATCTQSELYFVTDATAGQNLFGCTSTNTWTLLGDGGGGGGGITSLNAQTGSSQTFANDTNVTISSSGNTHTLGWTGQLAASRGGTGLSAFTPTGNTTEFGSWSGAKTSGRCVELDASGNLVQAAGGCGAGGGSVTWMLDGSTIASRATLNITTGTGITPALVDDGGNSRVNVTFSLNESYTNGLYMRLNAANTAGSSFTADYRAASVTAGFALPTSSTAAPVNSGFCAFETNTLSLKCGSNGATETVPWLENVVASVGASGNLTFTPGSGATGGVVDFASTIDLGTSTATRPNKRGTLAARPATCTVGDSYQATDQTAASQLALCTSTNTWTNVGAGGGGGTSYVIYDLTVAQMSGTGTASMRDSFGFGGGAVGIAPTYLDDTTPGTGVGSVAMPDASTSYTYANLVLPTIYTGNAIVLRLSGWLNSGTGTAARMQIETKCSDSGADFRGAYGTPTAFTITTTPSVGGAMWYHTLSDIPRTGCAAGEMLHFKISRLGSDGADTFTANVNLSATTFEVPVTGGGGGSGDVVGPASAVSGNLVSFNGTTGKLVQDSGKAAPTGAIVGTTDSQTVTNKTIQTSTITTPIITSYTVAGLPAATTAGQIAVVTDGRFAGDCTVGGGTSSALCRATGSVWASLGGQNLETFQSIFGGTIAANTQAVPVFIGVTNTSTGSTSSSRAWMAGPPHVITRFCIRTTNQQPANGALTLTVQAGTTQNSLSDTASVITVAANEAAGLKCSTTLADVDGDRWYAIKAQNADPGNVSANFERPTITIAYK